MSLSIRDIKKSKLKIGRPKTTGSGAPMLVRMHASQLALLDAWIAAQNEVFTRPEAVRRLLMIALAATKKGGR
jgi:hypothetical protein